MPSHLTSLALCVILMQSVSAASTGDIESGSLASETALKLTATNQPGAEQNRVETDPDKSEQRPATERIAEKSDNSDEKKVVEGRRTYNARLYGSLCLSCLKNLNAELKKRNGVFESTIDRAVKREATDGQPATYEKWAIAKVVYDASKISKDDITKRIKQSDFIVRKVLDVGENESQESGAVQ